MRLFNKHMNLLNIPKRIPNIVEWNIFYKPGPISTKVFQKLFDKIIFFNLFLIEPLLLFLLAFKIERLFNSEAASLYWISKFREGVIWGKKELSPTWTNIFGDTVSSKQGVHGFIIDLDSVSIIDLQV